MKLFITGISKEDVKMVASAIVVESF